jgi:nucleotide-binding universal stress UspA family protein
MKKLLAIIDDPNNSKELIKYAANLANDLKTDLHLLHVQNPEAYPLASPEAASTMTVQIQKGLEELADKAKNTLDKNADEVKTELSLNVSIDSSSEIGITKFIVENLVSENIVHMVILDSKEDVSFWEQNSNNMDIIYDIDCPVWVVPFGATYQPYEKIVYATNYKEEDITTLKKLLKLTENFKPEIVALHITDTTDFEEKVKTSGFTETVQSKTGYDKISVKALLERENDEVAQLINDYSKDIDSNLVVVLKENRHFLARLFKPSATKKLIKEAKLPVLVFHEKD